MKKPILPSEIVLHFHPSKFLWGWLLVFSIAVLICLWLCLSPIWAFTGTITFILACLWQSTRLLATDWKFSVHMLHVDVFGQMTVTNRAGELWRVEVLPDSIVHHACMVLHISYLELLSEVSAKVNSTRKQTLLLERWLRPTRLLILFDHVDVASQRELRVWLKWGLRDE